MERIGKVLFEVVGGDPVGDKCGPVSESNRRLEGMFSLRLRRGVPQRPRPQKRWQCRCDCGEILGSGYKHRISLSRVVPHCEGVEMRWELQPLSSVGGTP